MKYIALITIVLLMSACTSAPLDLEDEKAQQFRVDASEKTIADLKSTKNTEFIFGPSSRPTIPEVVKQRADLNKPIGNDAQIKLKNDYPYTSCKNKFAIVLSAKIDGKVIEPRKFGKGSRVIPGIHNVSVDLTVYYKLIAKHYSSQNYEVFFANKDKITVSVNVPVKESSINGEEIDAFINIIGQNINVTERVTLKDDSSKNPRCGKAWVVPG